MRTIWACLLMMVMSSAVVPAWAQQSVTGGGVTVHYSAINTTSLPADAARRLGITPRKSHALLLLSPRREDASPGSLGARASGHVRRLTGQRQDLVFRSVDTDGQRDLIAEFEIQDGERLAFDLSVLPEGVNAPLSLRFQQQFYRG